ncbi:MAG: hypothetical protein R3D05_00720 [Dongiaceae bacterium]
MSPRTSNVDTTAAMATVTLRRGALYLAAEVYERYFAGLASVILLRDKNDLLIMPVRNAAAGGYLLKIRNARGDRVIDAPDFFRAHAIDRPEEVTLPALWRADRAALAIAGLPASAN